MADPAGGQLPDPLTPADCDLRDFPFMPLEVARLRRSKAWLNAKRDPSMAFYLVNLWTAAWHDVPAASLEDDEDVLADCAMCDPRKWLKVRAAALRGWIKCSDGRLYHPVVAEKANEAWARKQGYRDRLDRARTAKAQRGKQVNDTSITEPITASITEPITGLSSARQGEREGQREKEGEGEVPPYPPLTRGAVNGHSGADVDSAFSTWNDLARELGLPVAVKLDPDRRRRIGQRLSENGGIAGWQSALAAVRQSAFCRGESKSGWRADLDFLCQAKSFRRLIEGAYRGEENRDDAIMRAAGLFADGEPELDAGKLLQ